MNTKEIQLSYNEWFLQSYNVNTIQEFEFKYLKFIENIIGKNTFKTLSNTSKTDLTHELAHMYFVQSNKINFSEDFLEKLFQYILNITDVR